MGKSHHHHRRKSRPAGAGDPDGAVYIGLLMIGGFGIWLWTIVSTDTEAWKHGLLGYVIAMAVLVNLYAWRCWFGRPLVTWQRSLARLVFRWAGYGTRRGRPLSACHGSDRARIMLLLSLATSAFVIAALTWLLYRA